MERSQRNFILKKDLVDFYERKKQISDRLNPVT